MIFFQGKIIRSNLFWMMLLGRNPRLSASWCSLSPAAAVVVEAAVAAAAAAAAAAARADHPLWAQRPR